jgi:hypothetical protein
MDIQYKLAGIDFHKRMLAVVVANARETELQFECKRFGTKTGELRDLLAWLQERDVKEVVMESTAQYWEPVWMATGGTLPAASGASPIQSWSLRPQDGFP